MHQNLEISGPSKLRQPDDQRRERCAYDEGRVVVAPSTETPLSVPVDMTEEAREYIEQSAARAAGTTSDAEAGRKRGQMTELLLIQKRERLVRDIRALAANRRATGSGASADS